MTWKRDRVSAPCCLDSTDIRRTWGLLRLLRVWRESEYKGSHLVHPPSPRFCLFRVPRLPSFATTFCQVRENIVCVVSSASILFAMDPTVAKAGMVASHYSGRENQTREQRVNSPIARLRFLNNWVSMITIWVINIGISWKWKQNHVLSFWFSVFIGMSTDLECKTHSKQDSHGVCTETGTSRPRVNN